MRCRCAIAALILLAMGCGSQSPAKPAPPPRAAAAPSSPPPKTQDADRDAATVVKTFLYYIPPSRIDLSKFRERCERVVASDPGDQDYAMVCAILACNGHDAAKAKVHIDRIKSPTRRGMARQQCLKNGVDVPID